MGLLQVWGEFSQELPNDFGCLNSVENWHFKVHQNQVIGALLLLIEVFDSVYSFFTVTGCVGLQLVLA